MTEAIPEALPATSATAAHAEAVSRNPFTVGGYRVWWIASVFAGSGVGIQAVTVQLFVRDRVAEDERAAFFAAALICQTVPGALFALLGGVVADRIERRRILVRTYTVAAAVSLVYVALAGADISVVWPVFILSAIVGSAGAFTNPARQSMMPQILHQSQIQNGAIFGTMAFMATLQFGGPMIGGFLSDWLGLTFAFGAEVAMLAVAAILFGLIATDKPVPTGKSVRQDLIEGLRYIRHQPALLSILALGTVPGIFLMGPFAVTVVLMVEDVFVRSDKWVGILWGCFGGGIVLGSIIMSMIRFERRGLLVSASVLMGGTLLAGYGASSNLALSMVLLVSMGIVGPAIFINYAVALLQENSDRAMMGRVMSMYGLTFVASTPVGYLQSGIQASLWGPQATIVSSSLIAAAIGLFAVLFLRPLNRLT